MHRIFILSLWFGLTLACKSPPDPIERSALLSFYEGVGGSSSYLGQCDIPWNSTENYCDWCGITCFDPYCNSVGSIFLIHAKLIGTISNSIGDLSRLRNFNLQSNQLFGPIPEEIGQLSLLQTIQLNENELTGNIPKSIANLTNLVMLDLTSNRLTGRLNSNLFSNLNRLSGLYLSDNFLHGSLILPKNCTVAYLAAYSTKIDSINMSSCDQIQRVDLHQTPVQSIQGVYPALSSLNLQGTPVMDLQAVMPNLLYLDLDETKFESMTSICQYPSLIELHLSNIGLAGALPKCISDLNKLRVLDISHNRLVELPTLNFVKILNANFNQLEGELEDRWDNLESGYFSHNRLSGSIPLIGATNLVLTGNNLTYVVIPPSIGYLDVRDNPAIQPSPYYTNLKLDWSVVTEEGCPSLNRISGLPLRMLVSKTYFNTTVC